MIGTGTLTFVAAGVVIVLTASIALRMGSPRVADLPKTAASPGGSPGTVLHPDAGGRLRILTGAPPPVVEHRRSAPLRALKLIGGITALAVLGSAGLIVAVRALIELFSRIGD